MTTQIYDPSLAVPTEISDAAITISHWMMKHGWREWELLGIADRKLVDKLRREIVRLENHIFM